MGRTVNVCMLSELGYASHESHHHRRACANCIHTSAARVVTGISERTVLNVLFSKRDTLTCREVVWIDPIIVFEWMIRSSCFLDGCELLQARNRGGVMSSGSSEEEIWNQNCCQDPDYGNHDQQLKKGEASAGLEFHANPLWRMAARANADSHFMLQGIPYGLSPSRVTPVPS